MLPIRSFGAMAFALLLAGPLAACGASDPTYYTLKSWPGMEEAGGPQSLKIRTPSVAGYLDRDYIVSDDQGYKLTLDHDSAWAEPLADLIGQTLTLDLQQRLPGTTVFAQAGAISTQAQATVELNVARFSKAQDGSMEITASLSVQPAEGGSPAGSTRLLHLTMPPAGSTIAAQVAALSQLLGQVADAAATQARRIGPQPAAPMAAEAALPGPTPLSPG